LPEPDSFPLPTIVFDADTLTIKDTNALWCGILRVNKLHSMTQLTMLAELSALIEEIDALAECPQDQLPQTRRSDIHLTADN
jgi:hypothetical protein